MGSPPQEHCDHCTRHIFSWRTAGFALLFLAMTGYCGLPSNPPPAIQVSVSGPPRGVEAAAADIRAIPQHFVVPTQAEEYRGRENPDDAESAQVKMYPAALQASAGLAERPSAPLVHSIGGVATWQVADHGGRLARAPPIPVLS